MQNRNHIVEILLDVDGLPPPTPEIQHERELAIYELLQENVFVLDRRGEKILPSAPLVLKLSAIQWFPREQMVPGFGNIGFKLKVGEVGISNYHQTDSPFGWHIIKRYE